MSAAGEIPAPIADDSSAPYWEAARRGKLLIQRCGGCGRLQFYPRAFCSACLAPDPSWLEAAGTGRIHTFSVVYRNSDPRFEALLPYVLAIIELDEGVRATMRILTTAPDRLHCEMPVRIVFEELEDGTCIPQATPSSTARSSRRPRTSHT